MPPTDVELCCRVQAGDRAAGEALLERHAGLIQAAIGKYRPAGMDREDLLQVARIALWHAAGLFDPERGVKFSSYGLTAMRRAVQRANAEESRLIYHPPNHVGAAVECDSLDEPLGDTEDRFGDLLPDPHADTEATVINCLFAEWALSQIPNREARALHGWCHGESYAEVAGREGVSRQAVCGRVKSAIRHLREIVNE